MTDWVRCILATSNCPFHQSETLCFTATLCLSTTHMLSHYYITITNNYWEINFQLCISTQCNIINVYVNDYTINYIAINIDISNRKVITTFTLLCNWLPHFQFHQANVNIACSWGEICAQQSHNKHHSFYDYNFVSHYKFKHYSNFWYYTLTTFHQHFVWHHYTIYVAIHSSL